MHYVDVLVIGAGLAGLATALQLEHRSVVVLHPGETGGSSVLARGGIAAAVGADDSPKRHAEDTLAAADGIAERRTVEILAEEGVERVEELVEMSVGFDRDENGRIHLGREAMHSRPRVVHAAGDETGRRVTIALREAVDARENVTFVNGRAVDLLADDGRVFGAVYITPDGTPSALTAASTVLATGGAAALYESTTNPPSSRGEGLAMASRAGAALADLEFVQFHPTALRCDRQRLPLLSEAIRGAGAVLVDEKNRRLMADHPERDLAGRDVVARTAWWHRRDGLEVFLDATRVEEFARRFPAAARACRHEGLDPSRDLIPVTPAAHYHMGGVATDENARSSLEGLWAVGEVASTGVHGANRLASNSLLEALVFGTRAGRDIAARRRGPHRIPSRRVDSLVDSWHTAPVPRVRPATLADSVRTTMWNHVGIERTGCDLQKAIDHLGRCIEAMDRFDTRRLSVEAAHLIAEAAQQRTESRGAHFRADYPEPDTDQAHRSIIRAESRRPRRGATTGPPQLNPLTSRH